MYIPESVKVRVRHDSQYDNATTPKDNTIPLGFITYVDDKGKLKKENSWNGWGDEYIGEFENSPMSGFKLENMVTRSRDYFGSGRTMYRVIHPNGFSFEISTDNLCELCMECEVNKCEFIGEYVLAWMGQSLILIGTKSTDYMVTVETTKLINNGNIPPTQLVIGKPYQRKDGKFIGYYLGRHKQVSVGTKVMVKIGDVWRNRDDYSGYYGNSEWKYVLYFKTEPKLKYVFANKYDHLDAYRLDYIQSPSAYECLKVTHEIKPDELTISNIALHNYGDVILPEYSDVSEIKEFMESAMDAYVTKSRSWMTSCKYDINIDWNLLPKANKYGK